ncbi:peptidylprolyl isomerase [Streptomyces roseicoloratus]|uniref:Peptidyl-prolyl cis-trans isomerase n=1 Tax=Streptomyces roseicoloratus TaxID=2508722 RepID=A0ABY9S0L6_9ACTN|nr:peptidylprolyl isomerase [Streptomyces roseicoloratus]WMX47962.1 peptidylprolyl isomerase [Streptomyces roseicoloratus]
MVSSDQRRRQLAREKYARQQQRRAEAQRRARRTTVIASSVAVVLAAGLAVWASVALTGDDSGSDTVAAQPSETPSAAPTEEKQPEPAMSIDRKATYAMALKTNVGDITITMDAAKAPHTVNSFKHLADKKYFDGTKCHRLTTSGIFVLQCGDPKGDGTGGPGYSIPDENLNGLGKAGQAGTVTYPKGTVAMANAGPNTGGSQFFLVYKDTQLPPNYTPFGTFDADGLKAVEEVAKAGVEGGAGDGAPQKKVTIEKAAVTKK